MTPQAAAIERILSRIEEDLCDRSRLGHEWMSLDAEARLGILDGWRAIMVAELASEAEARGA